MFIVKASLCWQLKQDASSLFGNNEGDRKTPLRSVQGYLDGNEIIIWFSDFLLKSLLY